MRKQLISLGIALLLGQAGAWADSYHGVEYTGGYPGFYTQALPGVLHVRTSGVGFEADNGGGFHIDYPQIEGQAYQSNSQSKRRNGFAIAGPHPVLLATSLGISALGNVLDRAVNRDVNEHFYTVQFRGTDGRVHDVSFRVPNQTMQSTILADVKAAHRAAQSAPPPQEPFFLMQLDPRIEPQDTQATIHKDAPRGLNAPWGSNPEPLYAEPHHEPYPEPHQEPYPAEPLASF